MRGTTRRAWQFCLVEHVELPSPQEVVPRSSTLLELVSKGC